MRRAPAGRRPAGAQKRPNQQSGHQAVAAFPFSICQLESPNPSALRQLDRGRFARPTGLVGLTACMYQPIKKRSRCYHHLRRQKLSSILHLDSQDFALAGPSTQPPYPALSAGWECPPACGASPCGKRAGLPALLATAPRGPWSDSATGTGCRPDQPRVP